MSVICSMKDLGSSGWNRPERSRSARTTLGDILPAPCRRDWRRRNREWRSAAAGHCPGHIDMQLRRCRQRRSQRDSARPRCTMQNFFIPLSTNSLAHHLARIEVERIDLAPLAVSVRRQLVRRAGIDRAPRRFRRRARIGIARRCGGEFAVNCGGCATVPSGLRNKSKSTTSSSACGAPTGGLQHCAIWFLQRIRRDPRSSRSARRRL